MTDTAKRNEDERFERLPKDLQEDEQLYKRRTTWKPNYENPQPESVRQPKIKFKPVR